MSQTMTAWLQNIAASKAKSPMPILSFPSVQLLGVTVEDLIASSDLQARGMKAIADAVPSLASVSMMDLSVEAEAFGSSIHFSHNEVPTVVGRIVETQEDAEALAVPDLQKARRCGLYIEAIRKVCGLITDRPIFAGIIGPFSLAGRLMDVTEIMVSCYTDPELVHKVMEKTTAFLTSYAEDYRGTGAGGILMAEPLTGLLSPELEEEFSTPYVKKIVSAVQTENFLVGYHNCGNNVPSMARSLFGVGSAFYHFGDSIHLKEMLEQAPPGVPVMGNISPSGEFLGGTPDSMRRAVYRLMEECGRYPNFVLSSGCDIPPKSSWDNIRAFFSAAEDFSAGKAL